MSTRMYRYISGCLAIVFGLVGLAFLFLNDDVVEFFNRISIPLGMERAQLGGQHFYVILSVAYMYVVALLAFLMYRHPNDRFPPLILFNAKIASSLISFLMFFSHERLLIYLANGIVDGSIGLLVLVMYRGSRNGALSSRKI